MPAPLHQFNTTQPPILAPTRTQKFRRQIGEVAVRNSTIVMIAFAVVFGLLAVFVAQSWLNSQAEARMRSLEANKKPVSTRTIVVAAKPLRFGNELTAAQLREMAWPAGGAAERRLRQDRRRDERTASASRSPRSSRTSRCSRIKITGPGQRATLSAMLRDGLKAVTIRVNDVEGVGGFVLPGDRVDVVADPPGRQEQRRATKSFCRTRACSRSTRSPTSAPTSRRWSRRSRSRSTWSARRSCRWPLRSARCR